MKRFFPLISLFLFGCVATSYFPEGSVDRPNDDRDWYSNYCTKALRKFGEANLSDSKKGRRETYRFLWLRTFHHPVLIRLEILNNGEAILTTKVASGRSAYRFGIVFKNKKRRLDHATAQQLKETIFGPEFWEAEVGRWHPDEGVDGAEWVVEAWKDGDYHVLADWSPEEGIVWRIGNELIEKSGIKLGEDELY